MDSSAFGKMNFDPLIWFAMFGMFCAGALALGAIGGLIWFVINHVRIV